MVLLNNSTLGNTPFQKILGHNRKIYNSWNELSNVLENEGYLSMSLKEELRRILAQKNGCQYCKAKGKPTHQFTDEKSSVCIGFVEVYLKMKENIPSYIIETLKETLTDEELIELITFTLFTTAQQHFGSILQIGVK
ncbi:carboxymuconolactone decarboxylase family protein [Mammaliicoccus sp. Dog046]|uniref:carboxymuconolactone decarboxylase family protein n=1 Tax=Mammaliicoccus sp. Dog046 TaxID=3034233 RepID=UPI002B25AEC1|nr:carboxymuconolactone decarboxylase family protein [Mammaliicoccus sp. Dog046]WQK86026.1 carboxymuconolactone decarboxylase family protein [Mammaliicoccus sp. Dog046]